MDIEHRLFFAFRPPPDVAGMIDQWFRFLGPGHRVRAENLHVTLAISGDYPALPMAVMGRMERAVEALSATPFWLVLDKLSGSGRSLALCPSRRPWQLMLAQRQLQQTLALSGVRRAGWRFNPHMTLLYRHGIGFSQPITPISWRVDELVLVHSHVGLTRHDILGRWPLVGRGSTLAA